jgi:exodeoxyribonuclease VII small subunit
MPARSPDSETPPATPVTEDLGDLDFETALAELESLVDGMEDGDMSLEASLAAFERGVKLTRHCQTALREAELKVKQLTDDNTLEAFDADALDDD